MDWIDLLGGGALGAILVKLIDLYSSRNSRMADAATTIAEGGAQAVKAVRDLLADYDKIMDEQRAEIEQLKTGREDRLRRIADLEQHNEDLQAHLIRLQNQQRDTEAKIARDTEATQILTRKYTELKNFTGLLLSFLKEKGVDLNGINDKIPDSVHKWNWPK